MSVKESLETLERLAEIAVLAGFDGSVNENEMRYELSFGLPEGRSQTVYIRRADDSLGEATVVKFFSPCLVVKSGMFGSGVSKNMALELLKMNEAVKFARFGIWNGQSEDMIVASVDHLLDQLDPDEFKHHVLNVALVADSYERKHGRDHY